MAMSTRLQSVALGGFQMHLRRLAAFAPLFAVSLACAQQPASLSKEVQKYVRVQAAKVVLAHVRVIDGTGHPAVEDQNVTLEGGRIVAIQSASDVPNAKDTVVLDLHGHTVMPGIVGMHNHLFYIARPNLDSRWHSDQPVLVPQMTFSAPRLYLAGGVTTMRTTGSVETYSDSTSSAKLTPDISPGRTSTSPGPTLKALAAISFK